MVGRVKVPRKISDFVRQHDPEDVPFQLCAPFEPGGDQPQAIAALCENLNAGVRCQTLLGVTGSGKTYSMANVIKEQSRPTLVIAPNKTLAAQLYSEFREFFPENRVRFFISYYDYYQPEAYIPSTDTYIEKDSAINDEIDKLRHSATRSVLEGRDIVIVASVSCIYGLGAPEQYFEMMTVINEGDEIPREEVLYRLVQLQYARSDVEFVRGSFRVRGETVDIFPADQDAVALRLLFFGDEIEEIREIDSITGKTLQKLSRCTIYPVSHFVTGSGAIEKARKTILNELREWIPELEKQGKLLEAQRLEQRTLYDLELLKEIGFCSGIENYSRHIDGRPAGSPPSTLMDYFPEDMLLILDESHVTLSQLGGMYRGDRSRKQSLVDYGFRLPSALDNRPLNPEEFWERVGQAIFVSATPGDKELELSEGVVVEQVNRPTGLLDPEVIIRPAKNQIDDLTLEIRKTTERGERTLVTTLTKKMAEDLSDYFRDTGIQSKYLHSDINAVERIELLRGLQAGDFDVLIGINLLREGLDLVEVSLVAILDADKEGFLRSTRALIQTIGRAARNINGRAILYADKETKSIAEALSETARRRKIQHEFNIQHGITPKSTRKRELSSIVESAKDQAEDLLSGVKIPETPAEQKKLIEKLKKQMFDKAARREFEEAATLRDTISKIQKELLNR
jgi:excinuclease ABC subunit B